MRFFSFNFRFLFFSFYFFTILEPDGVRELPFVVGRLRILRGRVFLKRSTKCREQLVLMQGVCIDGLTKEPQFSNDNLWAMYNSLHSGISIS